MPDERPHDGAAPHPIPDPQQLQPPGGLSNRHKRWMFYGVMGIVLLIVLANMLATSPAGAPKTPSRIINNPAQQQNPTPAQIRDMEHTLQQQETQLQDAGQKAQQLQKAAQQAGLLPTSPMTTDDLQRATALQDAAQARSQYQQTYGADPAQQQQIPAPD